MGISMNVGSSDTTGETAITMNKPLLPPKHTSLLAASLEQKRGRQCVTPATQAYLGGSGGANRIASLFASLHIPGIVAADPRRAEEELDLLTAKRFIAMQ